MYTELLLLYVLPLCFSSSSDSILGFMTPVLHTIKLEVLNSMLYECIY
jgi:hypothetical protein